MGAKKKHYEKIYKDFTADISKTFDCGRFCAPLNGGEPVCCDHGHAIPAASPAEWKVMKKRTDMWTRHKPVDDPQAMKEVREIEETCRAIVCKGARHCERDNRLMACRSFPFFPYMTKEGDVVGLAFYWGFADRCWVMSNLHIVEKKYAKQFTAAYEMLIFADEGEKLAFMEQSANMRRIYSRKKEPIPLIGRKGEFLQVLPKSGGKIVPADPADYPKHGPYVSDEAYEAAVAEALEIYGPGEPWD